jgi:dTMP kinase
MSTKAAEIANLRVAEATAIPFPKQRPMLVCLSGIDGSGKSRVAHRLEYAFRRQGIQAQYQWLCGGSSTFAEIVIRLFGRAVRDGQKLSWPYPPTARKGLKFNLRKMLWYALVAIDLVEFCIFKVRLPLLLGKVVICDRYTFDTFSDIASQYERDPTSSVMNAFEKFFHFLYPEPDLHYLLLADPSQVERVGRPDRQSDEDFYEKSRLDLTRYRPYARFLVKNVEGDFDRLEREIVQQTVKYYWQKVESNGKPGRS